MTRVIIVRYFPTSLYLPAIFIYAIILRGPTGVGYHTNSKYTLTLLKYLPPLEDNVMNTLRDYSTRITPQSQPIPGRNDMTRNEAGGYGWDVDDWTQMQRWNILGSESGSYYVGGKQLTLEMANATMRCIDSDWRRALNLVVDISQGGRAPKNDYALFTLAMIAGCDNAEARSEALKVLPTVARIGTHLFQFAEFAKQFRGWGTAMRRGISGWYNNMELSKLAYQVVKYQGRTVYEGQKDSRWGHKDLLKLSHPNPSLPEDSKHRKLLYRYITHGIVNPNSEVWDEYALTEGEFASLEDSPLGIIWGAYHALRATDKNEVIRLVGKYNLPHECVSNDLMKDHDVQWALLQKMPLNALVRSLARMTANGFLMEGKFNVINTITGKLGDGEYIRKSRLHPIAILNALNIYRRGVGTRGTLIWNPVGNILDALDSAFYTSFDNVESTGLRHCLAVDVSGSMRGNILGLEEMSSCMAAAAMMMTVYRTEAQVASVAFCHELVPISISRNMRLDSVMDHIQMRNWGSTDCASPILWALENNLQFDVFMEFTDGMSWAGPIHLSQALDMYRNKMGIDAKVVLYTLASSDSTLVDPCSSDMLDVVGFDTSVPAVVRDFLTN